MRPAEPPKRLVLLGLELERRQQQFDAPTLPDEVLLLHAWAVACRQRWTEDNERAEPPTAIRVSRT